MTRIISKTLVCGNCIQIIDVNDGTGRKCSCAKYNHYVSKSDPFCLGFAWNGLTESPKQLIRFSQGERELAAIPV